jgi:hypothetical protein
VARRMVCQGSKEEDMGEHNNQLAVIQIAFKFSISHSARRPARCVLTRRYMYRLFACRAGARTKTTYVRPPVTARGIGTWLATFHHVV